MHPNLYSVLDLPIFKINELISNKKISYKELFGEVEKQIEKYEKNIGAYITLNYSGVNKGIEKLKKGKSSLYGIPLSVKDTFVTKGIRTTAASKILEDFIPQYDATAYKRLKDAGMMTIGKTNMDEFAHGFTCEYSAFQVTKNPWNEKMVPGGSSGGSAASIASRTSLLSLASENFGSIVQPAALCGVVGMKPTYGRSSRYGIIAMASSLESPGIIARCVEDVAMGIATISGFDPLDSTTLVTKKEDLFGNLNTNIKGKKIAIIKPIVKLVDKKIQEHLHNMVLVFESMGASVHEIDWYDLTIDSQIYDVLYRSEVSSNLARYDGIKYGYRTNKTILNLDELYKENRDVFGEHVKRQIETSPFVIEKKKPEESMYYQVLKLRRKQRAYIDDLFKNYDAIVTPVTTFIDLEIGKSRENNWRKENRELGKINAAAICPTVLYGYPAISFPIALSNGTPVGVNMFSMRLNEQTLLNLAYSYQEETGLKCLNPFKTNAHEEKK